MSSKHTRHMYRQRNRSRKQICIIDGQLCVAAHLLFFRPVDISCQKLNIRPVDLVAWMENPGGDIPLCRETLPVAIEIRSGPPEIGLRKASIACSMRQLPATCGRPSCVPEDALARPIPDRNNNARPKSPFSLAKRSPLHAQSPNWPLSENRPRNVNHLWAFMCEILYFLDSFFLFVCLAFFRICSTNVG